MFPIYQFCTFTTHNNKLPEGDVQTSKHVAVLQETDIVNILCIWGTDTVKFTLGVKEQALHLTFQSL
jgi:hypothetical protein